MMNKDEAAGKLDQAKGAAKKKIGEWTNDPALQDEGTADKVEGKVREGVGSARRKVEDAADAVRENRDDQ